MINSRCPSLILFLPYSQLLYHHHQCHRSANCWTQISGKLSLIHVVWILLKAAKFLAITEINWGNMIVNSWVVLVLKISSIYPEIMLRSPYSDSVVNVFKRKEPLRPWLQILLKFLNLTHSMLWLAIAELWSILFNPNALSDVIKIKFQTKKIRCNIIVSNW